VFVNFTVEKDGSITDVKIIRGVHELLDKEAIRVVKSFPKWKPGKQRGKAVRVSYNIPISFVLK
jgi:protein TonB